MLYLNSEVFCGIQDSNVHLTLTSVVFELPKMILLAVAYIYLTLTSVVFESYY